MTEQKAWELLSLIDQIHIWGVTEHRDLVIYLLKMWHDWCWETYSGIAEVFRYWPSISRDSDGMIRWQFPIHRLPTWVEHLKPSRREKIQARANACLLGMYISNFRPHPAGHIQELFALMERFKCYGEGVEHRLLGDAAEEENGRHETAPAPKCLTIRPNVTNSPKSFDSPPLISSLGRVKRFSSLKDANAKKRPKLR